MSEEAVERGQDRRNVGSWQVQQRSARPDPVEVAVGELERAEIRLAEFDARHALPRFREHPHGEVDADRLKPTLVKPLARLTGTTSGVENSKALRRGWA